MTVMLSHSDHMVVRWQSCDSHITSLPTEHILHLHQAQRRVAAS